MRHRLARHRDIGQRNKLRGFSPQANYTRHPLSAKVGTNFVDKRRSLGRYRDVRQPRRIWRIYSDMKRACAHFATEDDGMFFIRCCFLQEAKVIILFFLTKYATSIPP
jgi:hypothetical protein